MSQYVEILPEGVELLRGQWSEDTVAQDFLAKRYPGLFMHQIHGLQASEALMDKYRALTETLLNDFSCGKAYLVNMNGRQVYCPGDYNQKLLKAMDEHFFFERAFMPAITDNELDSMISLILHGPLVRDDIPGASTLDNLIDRGFVVKIVVFSSDKYYAVTSAGAAWYVRYYGAKSLAELAGRSPREVVAIEQGREHG